MSEPTSDNLLQFETGDLPNSHHHHQTHRNKCFIPLISIFSILFVSLLIFSFYHYSSLNATVSSQTKELEDLRAYLNNNNNQIFTQTKTYSEQDILDQIFYPHGSDIIYTLDEPNLIREWTDRTGFHQVLKSSVSGDSIENFQSKTQSGKSYLVLVKTKKGHRFGAYTSLNFSPKEYAQVIVDVKKPDDQAFLFSLDKKEKYLIKNTESAIMCDESIAVQMGEGELVIKDNFLNNTSQTSFPKSFDGGDSSPFGLTYGDKEFEVAELEVYHVYRA